MVIVHLQGGLGNQMFQYACAKAFSLKHSQKLLIDNSFLNENQVKTDEFTPRQYELGIFKVDNDTAGKPLINLFETNSFYNRILKLVNLPYKKVYTENKGTTTQLKKVQPPVLLKGYWQSEQYFADYQEEIRMAFNFDIPESLNNTIDNINTHNSVSIHYRRGDYLTNPVAQKVLGTLEADYYHVAIKKIKSKIEKPFFYIFSDDTEWVKDNPPVSDNYRIIDGFEGDNHWYNMLLMSKCKHHIIANSSFSWWGAWLNPNPEKIVIVPKRWYANEGMNANTNRLIPATWQRV